jgi:glycosyltransferase involved in cell wall biosynthesis
VRRDCDKRKSPVPVDHSLKISIITPSYRQLAWLKLCAASIADQEGVMVEHIIQDAQTGPELEAWVRQNTRAHLHVEKDAGMYDAINRGLLRATGDICAYLNCDEQYLPGTLRRVAEYFDQHPEVDVLLGDSIITDDALNPVAYRRVVLPRRWHVLVRPLGVLTCSTFFRRRLVEEGALFDTSWKITGDKAWILDLLGRGYRMAVLPEPLALYALTGANLSQHPGIAAERARWRKNLPPMVRLARPLVVTRHLLEKWMHGAYATHRIDSAWFTYESFPQRQSFAGLTLGWKWPSISSASLL